MVELLAPAGEYNSLIGAISAGADAVYLAGNMYGARASAVNFTEEEIIKGLRCNSTPQPTWVLLEL